ALDILMERPIEELITPLPLNAEIRNALLNREGILGAALKCTLAYEEARFNEATFERMVRKDIADSIVRAIEWVDDVMQELNINEA
ncbi:MAG: hypothetical protein MJA83_01135, partial [Gammaproteobacteria bacterium]|nr:hypothetical protein [Gammaproteobacteria bacterium]